MIILRVKNRITFIVRSRIDQGIGIESIYISKLDQKFFRVPTGNVHDAMGFGLGLHYVRQMVKAHFWDMFIESQLGTGTSVTIKMKKKVANGT